MSKQEIIEQTVQLLEQLPEEKAAEILDFAAFLVSRKKPLVPVDTVPLQTETISIREHQRGQGSESLDSLGSTETEFRADLTTIVGYSKAYNFLNDEPDLYTDDDLIERYK